MPARRLLRPSRLLLAALAFTAVGGTGPVARSARAEEEPPTLSRALFLEKTSRDPKAALPVFQAVGTAPASDGTTRAEAVLGEARCLLALGREADAVAAWRRLEDDPRAPVASKEEARSFREALTRAKVGTADAEAEARAKEEVRRAEEARRAQEARLADGKRLVEAASAHVREKRYEMARAALLEALEKNPDDATAAAMLEEVGGYADRGALLRQAMQFVATNRVVDYRRLTDDVEALRKAGMRALREEKPNLAARPFREAVQRIDESDFYADFAETRRELVIRLKKALDDARAKGLTLEREVDVPPDLPPVVVKPWRSKFFAALGEMFTSGADPSTDVRFFDAAIPPDPLPAARGGGFAASGVAASQAAGTLRRARWIERYLRAEVAGGTWSGKDRLLERYDDLLVVQHAAGVLREVDALVAAFPSTTPEPAHVEIRVYAAQPGGVLDVLRLFEPKVVPADAGTAVVIRDRRIEEQAEWLSRVDKLTLLAQASVRLTGRHATLVRFREQTTSCPWYADRSEPRVVVADKDATYGLDLDLYAEDLPTVKGEAALSVVATVKRPDRPRTVPLVTGYSRVPLFWTQTLEADRRVPHAGSLMLLGLANPFRGTGGAGDLGGGTAPDLVVLVSAGREQGHGTEDIAPTPPPTVGPAPSPAPVLPSPGGAITREYGLGSLGSDILDEPPPEDWPSSPFGDDARPAAARAQRDAFLAGWLLEHAGIAPGSGTVTVKDGRVTATLTPDQHVRLAKEIEALGKGEKRLFSVEVRATEVPAERATAWLTEMGSKSDQPAQRLWLLRAPQAARLEERLRASGDAEGLFSMDARLAARHTQRVTTRALRSRSLVEEFRIVKGEDGALRTVPVNGTVEEGLLVSVRPVGNVGDLATVSLSAVLARIQRIDAWKPPEAPGEAPTVSLPRHQVERAGGEGVIDERDTLLLVVPAPGTDGTRVVLIRARQLRP